MGSQGVFLGPYNALKKEFDHLAGWWCSVGCLPQRLRDSEADGGDSNPECIEHQKKYQHPLPGKEYHLASFLPLRTPPYGTPPPQPPVSPPPPGADPPVAASAGDTEGDPLDLLPRALCQNADIP